jgi:DNA polymerase-3 subunit gamma/tau
MVRYLRNTLMAKIGGEQTELLQISGDERARSARSALLFTEEELTRNLQIVLRTFDDLNYRQEQRFHLELGLIKLIHAQRLLPIEELLSGVSSGASIHGAANLSASSRSAAPLSASRPAAGPARSASTAVTPAAPSISPFGPSSSGRSAGPSLKQSTGSVNELERTAPAIVGHAATFQGATPFPAATTQPTGYASTATLTEGALAKAPQAEAQSATAPSMESLRHAIGSALVDAGHHTAAELLGSAAWNLDGSSLRIEVPGVGKKMLSLTVNAAAEKIIRQQLQRLGAPTRFMVVPGEGAAATVPASAKTAAPSAGSIQETALANPLVQRAKEIFNAEVRSVLDLRQK